MRAIKETVLRTRLQCWQGRHLTKKGALPVSLLIFGLAFFILFVIYYHIQLERYEAEIVFLQASLSKDTNILRQQVQSDIVNALQADRVHLISKRGVPNEADPLVVGEKGLAAGSHYTHTGGGANYMCLDFNVNYTTGRYRDGNQGTSYIYGVEYRDGNWINALFSLQGSIEGNSLNGHSMPCAVCMALQKVNQVMIPGKGTCPERWNMEYRGYIMAEAHSHKHPGQFICVDDQPQAVPGTHGSQNGALLYMVETQCASLLCEPFVAGRELQCVVCSI